MARSARWSTTHSSMVNLPYIIDFRALCSANVVMDPAVSAGPEGTPRTPLSGVHEKGSRLKKETREGQRYDLLPGDKKQKDPCTHPLRERRGKDLNHFKGFYLNAKARIWP